VSDTLIDLIRHGEQQGGPKFRGQGCDDPLTPLGWAQMRQTLGDTCPWEQVLSSPLARCREFAVRWGEEQGLPVEIDPRWQEASLGAWEGLYRAQVEARWPQAYADFRRDPLRHWPPGAESLADLSRRVGAALDDCLQRYAGRRLLLVTHAGVIRALLGRALEAAPARWYRARVDYAGLTRLGAGPQGLLLDCHNCRRLP
jgi:probable phosphoglycerate mutase